MGHSNSPTGSNVAARPRRRQKSSVVGRKNKEFVPKTEAQITLSFDHRSIDGGGASRLLKRVIELLESPGEL